MKRFRVKVVGLSLALATGAWNPAREAGAADSEWRAPPTEAPAGAPALLPPAIRPGRAETIWLPAREPAPAPLVVPAGGQPDTIAPVPRPQPHPYPAPTKWPPEPVGPRVTGNAGPLPAIPDVPVPDNRPEPQPPQPMPVVPVAPAPRQPDAGLPKPAVEPPAVMPQPRVPDSVPLPGPRPVEAPPARPQPELPCAPPELMIPHGATVPGKHGTFGSPPIRLSRDYPPLRDLVHSTDITLAGADGALTNRFFVRGEYLLWWLPGYPVPVLATTNANTALNGFLGEPGTTAIVGPGALVGSTRSGFRLRAGAWIDEEHSCGIDAGFFFLGKRSETVVRDSGPFPLITRPIFAPNTVPGTNTPVGEFGELVAAPGVLRGTLTAQGDSRLWGADVNLRACLFTACDARAEAFLGYRHLNLRESLTITENITVIGPGRVPQADPVGTRVVVQDRFATRNAFNGAQIGAAYERRFGRWDIDTRASIALGTTHQTLDITGFQMRQQPGAAPMNFRGGLLAAGPNLGRFERDQFSVAPEFTLNFGYWVTSNVRVFAGYNFLLWTNVIRPGDQIDRVVDLTFVPNAPAVGFSGQFRPRAPLVSRDLAVNGIQFGLDWRW